MRGGQGRRVTGGILKVRKEKRDVLEPDFINFLQLSKKTRKMR